MARWVRFGSTKEREIIDTLATSDGAMYLVAHLVNTRNRLMSNSATAKDELKQHS